jgi:hypothetical protein
VEYDADAVLSMTGTPAETITLALDQGWNLVGGPSCTVDLVAATGDTDVLMADTFSGYNPGGAYRPATAFEPGRGYWIEASGAGQIALDCASAVSSAVAAARRGAAQDDKGPAAFAARVLSARAQEQRADVLTLRDAAGRSQRLLLRVPGEGGPDAPGRSYAMPPVPPRGVLDARFEDGGGGSRRMPGPEARLAVRGAEAPLTLRLEAGAGGGRGGRYLVESVDAAGRRLEGVWVEAGKEPVRLRLGDAEVLHVRREDALPEAFAVRGTSPNPARARDVAMRLDVPYDGEVRVRVHDVLGRAVVDIEGRVPAGRARTLRLPTGRLAAGLYLYRVELRAADGRVERATGRLTVVR